MKPEQEAIYNKLPTHIILRAGLDKWCKDDEYAAALSGGEPLWTTVWLKVDDYLIGQCIGTEYAARRPIPAYIREAQAWWILFNKLAAVDPDAKGGLMLICRYNHLRNRIVLDTISAVYTRGMRKFANESAVEDAIPILGGEEKIIEMLSAGPGVYEKWLMEEEK
jgi:hypothetical protein